MAVRSKVTARKIPTAPSPVSSKTESSSRQVSFKIPARLNITYILTFAVVIMAFMLGILTTMIYYLQKDNGIATEITGVDNSGQQQAGYSLGEEIKIGNGTLPALGKEDAKVTIVEFSDFQCPFCKQLFDANITQLKKDYVDTGKVKFVYRHYPLTSIHPNADKAAGASECANEQGKFWEYHDNLFETQNTWANLDSAGASVEFKNMAASLGLNQAQFSTCLDTDKYKANIAKDLSDGNTAGVTGTPATFINGKMLLSGGESAGALPYEEMKKFIEEEL